MNAVKKTIKKTPSQTTKTKSTLKLNAQDVLQQSRVLLGQGKRDDAVVLLEKQLDKFSADDLVALLNQLFEIFRHTDKEKALHFLDKIIELKPEFTLAWLLKASMYESLRSKVKAIDAAHQLLKLNPTDKELVEIARILSKFGEQRLALDAANKGFSRSGDIKLASYTLRVALQNADWDLGDSVIEKLIAGHQRGESNEISETPRTHLLWCSDEAVNQKVINNFAEKLFPIVKSPYNRPIKPLNDRKIRVGYLSSDFRDHATSILAMGMFRHHDKNRFEIFHYCTSFDDGSSLRRNVLSRAQYARTLAKLNDRDAAEVIYRDNIDVLVDLNGLTEGARLGILALRPANVQISYLGFPGSVGNRFVDYIIADDYTVPDNIVSQYPESVIRIPHTYQINDYIALYLPPKPTRSSMGLPEGVPIIGMFNNVNKVGREVWKTWMQIMQGCPEAILWMLDPGAVAKSNLMAVAKLMNINENRFIFAKKMTQEEHLARLQHCNIALDPWPYGGHTTTSDALFAGVPVIALEGSNFASRVSGGLLKAAGLEGLIAKSVEDYVATACGLLKDPISCGKIKNYLLNMRKKLPVFDSPSRTKYLEMAYVQACNIAQLRAAPKDFSIRLKQTQK